MRELFVIRADVNGVTPTFYSIAEIARAFEMEHGKTPISVTRIMLDIGAGSPKCKQVKIKASSTRATCNKLHSLCVILYLRTV